MIKMPYPEIEVKAYTTKELAAFYHISIKTFNKLIKSYKKQLGELVGRFYNILQVEIIKDKLGTYRLFIAKELAILYKVSGKTFSTWIKKLGSEIGKKIGRFFKGEQVLKMFNKLGFPDFKKE